MAKTMYSIQMDFQKAKNQADALQRIAREIRNVANQDMSGCMGEISANWKSENAKIYVAKGQAVAEHMRSVSSSLQQAADTIRTIAQNTYGAEKRALELAKTRKYK